MTEDDTGNYSLVLQALQGYLYQYHHSYHLVSFPARFFVFVWGRQKKG